MQQLIEYSPLLSFAASALMLVVWGIYLHLFWMNYRRQLRANVVISRGAGTGLDSLCIVGNMSAEPIFIEGVILRAERGETRWAKAITNLSALPDEPGRTLRPEREGPLKSGEYITVGTFRGLLELANGGAVDEQGIPTVDAIEVWIVADFSSEHELVFARRKFLIGRRGAGVVFRPSELETRRITRARERREVEEALQEHLEEAAAPVEPERRRFTVLSR